MRRPSSMSYTSGLNFAVSFPSIVVLIICTAVRCQNTGGAGPRIGDERIVFQTTLGDIELALYPDVRNICCHLRLPRDAVIMLSAGSSSYNSTYIEASQTRWLQQQPFLSSGQRLCCSDSQRRRRPNKSSEPAAAGMYSSARTPTLT